MTSDPGTSFPALRNGLAVLRAFDAGQDRLGVVEIAEVTGLHKSSVSRLLVTLEEEGLVERDPESRRYSLGLGLVQLAGPLLGNLDVRKATRETLRTLSHRTGESAALAVWSGSGAVIVEQEVSDLPIAHNTPLGSRFTTAASACVQAFLAYESPEVVQELLSAEKFDLPHGQDTTTYLNSLATGRAAGVFVNDRATEDDAIGVASPVFDHRGELAGALLVAAPAYRTDEHTVTAIKTAVSQAAGIASRRLGHS